MNQSGNKKKDPVTLLRDYLQRGLVSPALTTMIREALDYQLEEGKRQGLAEVQPDPAPEETDTPPEEPVIPDSESHRSDKCKHRKVMPKFNEKLVRELRMSKFDVRKKFPRFVGKCPDCQQHLILYASRAHFVYGDW